MRKRPPLQPIVFDEDGWTRFQENRIVKHLLAIAESRGAGLNALAAMRDLFPVSDWEQFAQLIGYSLAGFGELSYVRDETYTRAAKRAEKLMTKKPRARKGKKK